ncbi:ABC transporter ATP-binding protein [Sedimentitalea sp. HM32M-2]|uniref:ABC transporter ATP-binding protein n=1 Tax=Sedimentitalea sp. HM32M-2 TaxID=3351566 RepID=UPI003636F6C6
MMAISHLLEDFSVETAANEPVHLMSDDGLEDLRLASFEQGYTAGWDDAIRAQAEDQTRITGALGGNLEDLSFTYQEALAQMMSSVEPVFRALVESVLPQAMMQTVGLQIVEQCSEMARQQIEQPVTLKVPPGAADAIEPALRQNLAMPVEIVESRDMGPGQVCLQIGDRERQIDSQLMLSSLQKSIDAFFHTATKVKENG